MSSLKLAVKFSAYNLHQCFHHDDADDDDAAGDYGDDHDDDGDDSNDADADDKYASPSWLLS